MNKTLLKWIGWGIILCIIIWAWKFFPGSKTDTKTSETEKQIIFDKNLDRDEAAKNLFLLEINSSSYSKKLKAKAYSSKISSKNNIATIATVETIKVYDDNEIIDSLLWNTKIYTSSYSSSYSSFSSFSSNKIFDTKNFCDQNSFICEIVNFETQKDERKLQTIKTILDRFWYNRSDYLNSINITENSNWRRGYATHSHIVINWYNLSDKEFWEVFTHELGHIIDLGIIKWDGEKTTQYTEFWQSVFAKNDPSIDFYRLSWDWEKTRKAGAKSQDFVSGYGMSDPFEDYAECFNMYINHKNAFLAMTKSSQTLKQKYDIIDKNFSSKYFFEDNETAKKVEASPFWRPWDSTRMN